MAKSDLQAVIADQEGREAAHSLRVGMAYAGAMAASGVASRLVVENDIPALAAPVTAIPTYLVFMAAAYAVTRMISRERAHDIVDDVASRPVEIEHRAGQLATAAAVAGLIVLGQDVDAGKLTQQAWDQGSQIIQQVQNSVPVFDGFRIV